MCFPTFVPEDSAFVRSYPESGGDPQYQAPFAFLNLDEIEPTTRLSRNFTLEELAQAWKGKWAVVQPASVTHLQQIRDRVGWVSISSGYRNPQYNERIGGAAYSRHLYGDGFDLITEANMEETADACWEAGADYVAMYNDGHVHCDWRNDPLDPAFFAGTDRLPMAIYEDFHDAEIFEQETDLVVDSIGFEEGEPLLIWEAYNALGSLIDSFKGPEYAPPRDAVLIEVNVGGVLSRSYSW